VTASVAPTASAFEAALAEAVTAARAHGASPVEPSLLEFAAALTPEQLTIDTVAALAEGLGFSLGSSPGSSLGSEGGGPLPPRRATINTLVEAAAPPVREALFSAFLRLLQRPTYGTP
jgi:hypothetical protein